MIQDHALIGRIFGRLTVKSEVSNGEFLCFCLCGKEIIKQGRNLLKLTPNISCGCFRIENVIKGRKKHGLSDSRINRIWYHMKNRCYNKKHPKYKDYGGRGITVCDEWIDDFQAFVFWAFRNGYKNNLSIDRDDNDKGYSPDNCRWVNNTTQCRNKRTTFMLEYNGVTKPLMTWCDEFSLYYPCVYQNIKYRARDFDYCIQNNKKDKYGK
jgi:hypothetical protein